MVMQGLQTLRSAGLCLLGKPMFAWPKMIAPYWPKVVRPAADDKVVYRARPFLALVLYAQGEGSSKDHFWNAIN